MQTRERSTPHGRPVDERLAGAPISWGVCEVPGWGAMPSLDSVLAEMEAVGLRGTELGAPGFLPADPDRLLAVLEPHGLRLVGGFVPLVLHEPEIESAVQQARDAAALFARASADVFVLAIVQDDNWAPPQPLDDIAWRRLARHIGEIDTVVSDYGLTLALHPHAGTLIETAEQVQRALQTLDVGWCLDTGHLLIGGVDPVRFTTEHGDRIVHVHLKDVDRGLAARLRAGDDTLLQATRRGLFRPLGQGDAEIGGVLEALDGHGYDGWLVLEQDTAITDDGPTSGGGPMLDAQASIAFLHNSARTTQEVN
jgi:inosose dehydratase